MKKVYLYFIPTLLLLTLTVSCADTNSSSKIDELGLVPLPESIVLNDNQPLQMSDGFKIFGSSEDAQTVAMFLVDEIGIISSQSAEVVAAAADANVLLELNPMIDSGSDEAYTIEVGPNKVNIQAKSPRGLTYAVHTLVQLVHSAEINNAGIPALIVNDSPRFSYRGLHLDVGRHMYPVSFIKKYIDNLARHKLNIFHWHLTEDQGWRIEIKKYPRLTEVGSFRKETILEKNFDPYVGDGEPYGGFYTQEEVKEVVAHATMRGVTIIPEIEMPGHSTAAIAAYPELGCTDEQLEVETVWGVHAQGVYCPKESTFEFLEDVLEEVVDLFPSPFIHIGGDEAPKTAWQNSSVAQEVMKREGLKSEDELQSYFIKRIEKFLLSHNRYIIGWDEILEGGLAPEATVMSWRGVDGGIEAARQGHKVIMTPTSNLYFDYYQGNPESEPLAIGGDLPIEKVYAFEPVPPELDGENSKYVIGAQGNVWTEYMKTSDHVEYMAYPRASALAEVVWSPKSQRDWQSFRYRMSIHEKLLAKYGLNSRALD